MKWPGMRTIKTCIAVFICFVIDYMRGDGVPFYGAIAAILCIKKDMKDSIKTGKNRLIATVIGCIAGALFLFIEQSIIPFDHELVRYLILTMLLIPVIYFSVMIKQPDSTYLSCVVFLSVTINHADETPLSFAVDRFIDTSIGIAVALFVNWALFYIMKVFKDQKAVDRHF